MVFDPESIGIFIGTVLSSAGATIGGLKVIDRVRPSKNGFCTEHHKCFDDLKKELKEQGEAIHGVKEDVSWICGAMGKPKG